MEADGMPSNAPSGSVAEESKRPRKKRKSEAIDAAFATVKTQPKKRVKGKGKVGKLEGLMLLPMDVLFEIFGHLRPLDILHLARTTKQFRHVLMHKSAISVWKAARANVIDFPECFPGMNEAQFANLAFDQHCHVCLAPNIRSVDWVSRVRLCPKCTKTNYVEVLSILPLQVDFDDEACERLTPTRLTSRSRQVAFVHELNSIKEHWATLKDEESRSAYAKERRAFKEAVNEHAETCYIWFKNQQYDRTQELEQARQGRKNAVIEKLRNLGWGSEIEKIPEEHDLGGHRLVKQPTRLTERIWKNIQPEMVKYMEEMKTNRLNRERDALIVTRKSPAIDILCAYKKSQLPWTELMPEAVDFCNFGPVKAVLELPNEVKVDELSFAEVVPLLPSLFTDWRADINKMMLEGFARMLDKSRRLRQQGYGSQSFDISDAETSGSSSRDGTESDEYPLNAEQIADKIALATTVFKCNDCSSPGWAWNLDSEGDDDYDEFDLFSSHRHDATQPLFYPKVMGHRCLTYKVKMFHNASDPSTSLNHCHRARTSWSYKRLWIDKEAKKMMESIVEHCGLDPAFATAKDMDDHDTLLGCPLCAKWNDVSSDNALVPVFGWRTALKHHSLQHYPFKVRWILLSEEQTAVAREAEEADRTSIDRASYLANWSCTHCLDRPCEQKSKNLATVKQHLISEHEVTDPQLNTDYHATDVDTIIHGSLSTKITIAVKRSEKNSWVDEYEYEHEYEHDFDNGFPVGFSDDDVFFF